MGCPKLTYDQNESPLFVSARNFKANEKSSLGFNHFEARMYDPLIGRWLAVDPARQHSSPYLGMSNNPVNGVDPDGRRDLRFDADGNYIGVFNDKWWHNLLFGTRGQYADGNGGWNNFKFASGADDYNAILDGTINRLEFVSTDDVRLLLEGAGAFDETNQANAIQFLLKEGKGGGKFDFSYTAIPGYFSGASSDPLTTPSPMLFLVDGVAHNHMNFGNFLFGAGGGTLGVGLLALRAGAHYNSVFNSATNAYKPQLDSSDDQFSIQHGFNFSVHHHWAPRIYWSLQDAYGRYYARPFE